MLCDTQRNKHDYRTIVSIPLTVKAIAQSRKSEIQYSEMMTIKANEWLKEFLQRGSHCWPCVFVSITKKIMPLKMFSCGLSGKGKVVITSVLSLKAIIWEKEVRKSMVRIFKLEFYNKEYLEMIQIKSNLICLLLMKTIMAIFF